MCSKGIKPCPDRNRWYGDGCGTPKSTYFERSAANRERSSNGQFWNDKGFSNTSTQCTPVYGSIAHGRWSLAKSLNVGKAESNISSKICYAIKPLWIKLGPWILYDVSIEVRAVDEAGGVAGDEHAGVEVAVAEPFVDEAGGVGVLAVGFLAIEGGAAGGGLFAEGFVLGPIGQRT